MTIAVPIALAALALVFAVLATIGFYMISLLWRSSVDWELFPDRR